MRMYIDPAIELIKAEIDTLKKSVTMETDVFRELLLSISKEDHDIYDACFRKSVNDQLGGDPASYAAMLRRCADLKSGK